jgi:hypothetical protein
MMEQKIMEQKIVCTKTVINEPFPRGGQQSRITKFTYSVFDIIVHPSVSGEENYKCPYCGENVKIINHKGGFIPQEKLEPEVKKRHQMRIRFGICLIASLILYFIFKNPNFLSLVFQLLTLVSIIGLMVNLMPVNDFETGYVTIENPKNHLFVVPSIESMPPDAFNRQFVARITHTREKDFHKNE